MGKVNGFQNTYNTCIVIIENSLKYIYYITKLARDYFIFFNCNSKATCSFLPKIAKFSECFNLPKNIFASFADECRQFGYIPSKNSNSTLLPISRPNSGLTGTRCELP